MDIWEIEKIEKYSETNVYFEICMTHGNNEVVSRI